MTAWSWYALFLCLLLVLVPQGGLNAAETKIVLREHLNQRWSNQLLTYPFSAPRGACHPGTVTLFAPQGQQIPVQLSEIEFWPGTESVKSGKLSFITDLAPLAEDTYTVRYEAQSVATKEPITDLQVVPGEGQTVDITTSQFGARLLMGERTYAEPVPASQVPGPVVALRLADGTWFGGSEMYGPTKLTGYSATLTDRGPVFACVAVRYTYENGNTMDLAFRIVAGDNTIRCDAQVKQDQPDDGFRWVLSRGLPPFIFHVQDEARQDRPEFTKGSTTGYTAEWAAIPLKDYRAPEGKPAGLVTSLTPWEDWFGTFTQRTIRLQMEGTTRELQIHSLDPGAWVEPRDILEIFDPNQQPDPAKGAWVSWQHKLLPLMRDPSGEVYLAVNAAAGVRKWTISDCLSVPGAAPVMVAWGGPPIPSEAGPTVGDRLDEVKDYVLSWPGDEGKHPRLFLSRQELEDFWARTDPDPALFNYLLERGRARSPEEAYRRPNMACEYALGAYLVSEGSPEVAEQTQLLARVHNVLRMELKGHMFGSGTFPPVMYDAVVDAPWVPEPERTLLRAEMAYMGYRMADPATWSAERGYCSGNSNMTVNWVLPQGLIACAIPEHPMAKTWFRNADRIMEQFLSNMVGPAGEWPEALGGHGLFSVSEMLTFAIAATNAGFRDYVNDPRFKRLLLYQAKMHTPRDPRPRGHAAWAKPGQRYIPALGRDTMSPPWGISGAMARATLHSDPDYSAVLQWLWLESGAGYQMSNHFVGWQYVYLDKSLPAKQPDWTSEVLPRAGAILRHGLGTAEEHQVMLLSGDHNHAFYPGHTGSFPAIFAYGVPVAGSWPGGYQYQDELLTCHVTLARGVGTLAERSACCGYAGTAQGASMWNWPKDAPARFGERGGLGNVSAFSALPRQDYAAVDVALHYPRSQTLDWPTNLPEWPPVPAKGKPPVDWRRQVLWLKDDDPAKAAYLLIRDTVKGVQGPQPTMWQMWTVSEKIATPEEVKDLGAFLADKPGNTILPARELKGDRFTAIGQLGVDVEYFIASPTDTPRYTLRWGTDMHDWANKLAQPEYQDLLHLQMPGDGAYFVAFYPRKRTWPVPTFATLGNGLIIKVSGDFGTDYGFLSALSAQASGEQARFQGTAASVQDRETGLVLCLGAAGEVRYREYGLAADFAAALRVGQGELKVELPEKVPDGERTLQPLIPFPGGQVTIFAPGKWNLAKPPGGVRLRREGAGLVLQVPPGVSAVTLALAG